MEDSNEKLGPSNETLKQWLPEKVEPEVRAFVRRIRGKLMNPVLKRFHPELPSPQDATAEYTLRKTGAINGLDINVWEQPNHIIDVKNDPACVEVTTSFEFFENLFDWEEFFAALSVDEPSLKWAGKIRGLIQDASVRHAEDEIGITVEKRVERPGGYHIDLTLVTLDTEEEDLPLFDESSFITRDDNPAYGTVVELSESAIEALGEEEGDMDVVDAYRLDVEVRDFHKERVYVEIFRGLKKFLEKLEN